jgi:hypothetical protein
MPVFSSPVLTPTSATTMPPEIPLPISVTLGLPEGRIQELRAAFKLFDREDNGAIDANELEKIVRLLGNKYVSRKRIDKLIEEMDGDGDGKIDFEDFCKMVSTHSMVFGLFDLSKLWQVEQLLVQRQGCEVTPFQITLQENFPGAMPEATFVDRLCEGLKDFHFKSGTCIACISLCRDEITEPLV